MAKILCRTCQIRDNKTKMIQEANKKYYHVGDCHKKYLEEELLKQKEREEWNALYEYIKQLHSIPNLAPRNIKRLQELRNGYDFKEGKRIKRYKQGAEFGLLLDAYRIAEDKIKWFMQNVLKDTSSVETVNASMSIAIDRLNEAWKARERRKRQQEEIKQTILESNNSKQPLEIEITYRSKKSESDISEFL